MTRWQRNGYAEPGLFPGANSCRFRLCDVRDDGLIIMTLGDQRSRGGQLSPVFLGAYFFSVIGRIMPNGDPHVVTREVHARSDEARDRHEELLREWMEWPA